MRRHPMRAPLAALWLLAAPALAQQSGGTPGPSPPSPAPPARASEIGQAPAPAPPSAPPASIDQRRPVIEPPLDAPPLPVAAPAPSVPPSTPPPSMPPPPVTLGPPLDPTSHRHLGLYFHFDLGGGVLRSSASSAPTPAYSGPGVPVSAALGTAFAENWIVTGDLWVCAAPAAGGFGPDKRLALTGIGVGITHYFMPANVFVSLSPSVTVLVTDQNDVEVGRTEYGFGGKVALGKEWWGSDHWGVGVAAQFFFGINKDRGTDPPTWTSLGGGVVFSATFN